MRPYEHPWGVCVAADRVWAQVAGLRPDVAGGRLFMVLQAYIDESADDGGLFVLAGYISTAERWAAFSKEWAELLPRWGSLGPDGERRFKMSEMAQSPERMSRVSAFHDIIMRHAIMSIAAVVDENDLQWAKDQVAVERNAVIDWDSADNIYFIAYRCLMDGFHAVRVSPEGTNGDPNQIELFRQHLGDLKEPVDFYFDEHSNKKVILAQWDEYVARRPIEYRRLYGSQPRFERDELFLPLQAADFRAWWLRKRLVDHGFEALRDGKYDYGFKTSDRKIFHLIVRWNSEQIAENLRVWLDDSLEIQRAQTRRADPPAPLSLTSMRRFLARLVRGQSS